MAVPTSRQAKVVGHLRQAIADSPTFVNWVGAQEPDGALARVFVDALPRSSSGADLTPAELSATRPYALIRHDTMTYNIEARPVVEGTVSLAGSLSVVFESNVTPAIRDDNWEVYLEFWNAVGQIIDEICGASEGAGHLAFRMIEQSEGHGRGSYMEQPEQDDFIFADVVFSYGPVR